MMLLDVKFNICKCPIHTIELKFTFLFSILQFHLCVMYNVLDSGWSPLGLRKPLDMQLGSLEQFDLFFFGWVFKLLVSGYGWWSIYDFLVVWRWYASMVVYL